MKIMRFLAGCMAALCVAGAAHAQSVAITGAKLVRGDGSPPIENGTVVISNGKVTAAGAGISVPAGATVVDAAGKWVTPGLVAGFSRVGLVEVDAVRETNDASAYNSIFGAGLDIAPAINPWWSAIAVSRAAGVTRSVTAPQTGNTIFGGQGAIIDLGADPDPIMQARAFQFAELGERGSARAGGSRAASHLLLRAMLREARDYASGRSAFDDELLKAEDAKALLKVLSGEQRLLVHVESAHDILEVLSLRSEYPSMKLVIVGASEGWMVADRIAASSVPVIASALNDLPYSFEKLASTQSNIGRMVNAGVNVAIGMIDDNDAHQIRYSPQYAGNLVAVGKLPGATGVGWDEAFAMITSRPAEIMGLGGKIGVLASGAVGDVVIWDGDPLELSSAPEMVYVDGVQQPLVNHQTRLRDRYRSLDRSQLPKAYDH